MNWNEEGKDNPPLLEFSRGDLNFWLIHLMAFGETQDEAIIGC